MDSLLRISQASCEQLCEKQTLDYGIVFSSRRFAGLPECNQYREVIAETPEQLHAALAECETCFSRMGLHCRRWAPAQSRVSDDASRLLASVGYRPQKEVAFALAGWVVEATAREIRILPARAMRSAFSATFVAASWDEALRAARIEAALERLDSPHLDMFVALRGSEPAGRCGLLQVGDLCEVIDLSVLPTFAECGVGSALLAHVLALAKRLALRNVYARVSIENEANRRLFERHGFAADGVITEFVRTYGPAGLRVP